MTDAINVSAPVAWEAVCPTCSGVHPEVCSDGFHAPEGKLFWPGNEAVEHTSGDALAEATQGGLAVSQEARDAAADYFEAIGSLQEAEMARTGRLRFTIVIAFQRAIDAAEARQREADAKVAEAHKPTRSKPLSKYNPDDREIIRAEENGEAIAASCIAAAIREGTTA